MWFGAKFDAEETQTQVETILRVLGDTGIGGERSAGTASLTSIANSMSHNQRERWIDLLHSRQSVPRDADELDRLIQGGDIGYTLEERSGWIGSTEGNGLRRQQIWMFGEGSVLSGDGSRVGRLIDLKPEACPHPVWRYAYAWPIKI